MVRPLVTWPDKGYILMTYQGGTLSIKSSLTGVLVLYKYIEYQPGLIIIFPVKLEHQLRSLSWRVCLLTVCEFMYVLSLVMF